MNRKLSDQQIDRLAERLLRDFAPDDGELDEIADSPKIWWNVRKAIETQKTEREKRWFAAFRPPILAFGALTLVVCFGLAALFLNYNGHSNPTTARQNPVRNPAEEIAEKSKDAPETVSKNPEISQKSNPAPEKVFVKNVEPKAKFAVNQRRENSAKQVNKQSKKEISPSIAVEETKTDFIALSYAANTDGGQIVRVKVPGAMMVSLGLKANVENESEMVNAEVVIGDDGLARAIRFIR